MKIDRPFMLRLNETLVSKIVSNSVDVLIIFYCILLSNRVVWNSSENFALQKLQKISAGSFANYVFINKSILNDEYRFCSIYATIFSKLLMSFCDYNEFIKVKVNFKSLHE